MKVVQINAICGTGSTGKICVAVSQLLNEQNIENYILYSSGNSECKNAIKISSENYIKLQALKSRVLGNYGFNSKSATRKMIQTLEKIKPDIVHLHNLHGHDCDLEMLFDYFRQRRIKLFWTFHDCWAFTGYCPHFAFAGCSNWKNGCGNCPQRKGFSWFRDLSQKNYERKKRCFSNLDLTIITPSYWLAGLVKESFLCEYPVKVIHNGIDLEVFKPTPSDFRQKYGCEDRIVLLGVAFGWGVRKGLDVFVELSKRLDDRYQIVLVGTSDKIDKQLPDNIISIHRTHNQQELAEIYTAADLFINPTREEVLGLVNIESLACGTPVITFDTGGSPECIDVSCGRVVESNSVDGILSEISRFNLEHRITRESCRNYVRAFDKRKKFYEYLALYCY